jgi:homopolymeric O-antigen transport system permease protein
VKGRSCFSGAKSRGAAVIMNQQTMPSIDWPETTVPRFTLRVQPSKGLSSLDLRALWEFRDLVYFLVWRDIALRYKQTAIGAAWTVLQPLLTMAIFTVIFGNFAKMPSDGVPYPIFAFVALVPWTYFSHAISRSGVSLVNDAQLVRKVYFPRLIIPIASAAAPLMDLLVSFAALVLMMVWYGIPLRANALALPVLTVGTVMTAVATALWLSPLNARYRDIGYAIPFLIQFWFFASPITYPLSIVPHKWRVLYGLNPMVGVIEGFRWALLGTQSPDLAVTALSAIVVSVMLVAGLVFFKRMERTLSDVI